MYLIVNKRFINIINTLNLNDEIFKKFMNERF